MGARSAEKINAERVSLLENSHFLEDRPPRPPHLVHSFFPNLSMINFESWKWLHAMISTRRSAFPYWKTAIFIKIAPPLLIADLTENHHSKTRFLIGKQTIFIKIAPPYCSSRISLKNGQCRTRFLIGKHPFSWTSPPCILCVDKIQSPPNHILCVPKSQSPPTGILCVDKIRSPPPAPELAYMLNPFSKSQISRPFFSLL